MICSQCVAPPQLKAYVISGGAKGRCAYCQNDGTVLTKAQLFDHIYALVDMNVATKDDLSAYDLGLIYECGDDSVAVQTIDVVLSEWFDLGDAPYFDELLAHASDALLKDERGNDRHFFSDDGELESNLFEVRWDTFINDIKHAHRFFNPKAKEFLDSVFDVLTTPDGNLKQEAVRVISRGDPLYRARKVADYPAGKKIGASPHTELGPTPKTKAGSQRMTPNGISALYCSLERNTCLSEIRSITGDMVISGALTPTTQLRLLDLTKLAQVERPNLTLLDEGFRECMHLMAFLKSLVAKMSKPKRDDDELAYLSTQVVFEYLRLKFIDQVDGLVFPSVQTGEKGTNIALFPEASVISEVKYEPPDENDMAIPEPRMIPLQYKEDEKLAYVNRSLRYHHIKAIETKSEDCDSIHMFFMSDLIRRRLNL